jgi:mannose/cellobiose epimerase-like protein (N-acyl-D-glucosamine 2-epimerase family)
MIFLSIMGNGIHSTIDPLKARLVKRWGPKWHGAFRDPSLGGYYERLNRNFKPILTGQRRLVSQCRQLSIYSHMAHIQNSRDYNSIRDAFEFIAEHYHDTEGGHWWFSLDDSGEVKERYTDLYALSFVIFSFSHYYRATGDNRARNLAGAALNFIQTQFRIDGLPGYAESINGDGKPLQKLRRQNPHMHLLEACLFAHEVWGGDDYAAMADELVALFYNYFFDKENAVVREFFNDDLSIHEGEGHKIEPGHAFEWVWLLKKHQARHKDTRHEDVTLALLKAANKYGWDEVHGGIYDTLAPTGEVIADTKRIWPFCEALKANVLMLESGPDRQSLKDRTRDMVNVFKDKYIDERGFWTEWLTCDLSAVTDYMPATTPYHVYFGIMETSAALEARGGGKSIANTINYALYALRRNLSFALKKIKSVFGI